MLNTVPGTQYIMAINIINNISSSSSLLLLLLLYEGGLRSEVRPGVGQVRTAFPTRIWESSQDDLFLHGNRQKGLKN